jgi:ABC-type bacteriocin/lantibiotic exporter with double-glycine peptidase domain
MGPYQNTDFKYHLSGDSGNFAIPYFIWLCFINLLAMEQMTVPLISLVSGVILWCIWLTIKTFQNDKAIAINTSNDAAVNKQISDVKNDMTIRIDKLENHFDNKFDQVSSKFDKVFEKIESLR